MSFDSANFAQQPTRVEDSNDRILGHPNTSQQHHTVTEQPGIEASRGLPRPVEELGQDIFHDSGHLDFQLPFDDAFHPSNAFLDDWNESGALTLVDHPFGLPAAHPSTNASEYFESCGERKTSHVNCIGGLLSIVDSVQLQAMASRPLGKRAPTEVRSFASVLVLNRESIKEVETVLSCNCVAREEVISLCYAAALAIGKWYEAALAAVTRTSAEAETNAAKHPLASSMVVQAIALGVIRFQTGFLHVQALRQELAQHMEPLLAKLQARCTVQVEPKESLSVLMAEIRADIAGVECGQVPEYM